MKTPHLLPLSRQALELLKAIREISGECDLVFIGDHDFRKLNRHGFNRYLGVI